MKIFLWTFSYLLASLLWSGPLFAEVLTVNEKRNSIKCMKWVLKQYPKMKKRATYLPEHNILIEVKGEKPNEAKIIHTETGSLVSVDGRNIMDCTPRLSQLDNRRVKGIYDFTALALNTKLQYLEYIPEDESKNTIETIRAFNFLAKMPLSCTKAHPKIRKNVEYYCDYVKETKSKDVGKIKVCR